MEQFCNRVLAWDIARLKLKFTCGTNSCLNEAGMMTSQTLKQMKREEGLTARSEIETIFQLIDVAEWRAPHTNHYDGSCLDQISSIVGGRRHQPSPQLARLAFNGNCH